MAAKIIYDASVLLTGHLLGKEHKTGLYRVSNEVLTQLIDKQEYEIYLFDVYFRERELRRFAFEFFPGCRVVRTFNLLHVSIIFPIGNLIDRLRSLERQDRDSLFRYSIWGIKNLLLLIEKTARKINKAIFAEKVLKKSIKECKTYYSTYYPIPEVIRNNYAIQKVYTVHDLIPILFPEYFSSSFNTQLVKEVVYKLRRGDRVICVSDSTRNDLLVLRPDLNPNDVYVSHLAAAEYFYPLSGHWNKDDIKSKFGIPLDKKIILSVCTLEPRKNLKTLISAYRNVLENGSVEDVCLVLTGAPYWGTDPLINEIEELNRGSNASVILTGFVSDSDLNLLYNIAYLFVYPSYYEGFGLPPLEAMQCGVPVICSNTSSIPEIVNQSGIMINPGNDFELSQAITKICNDADLHQLYALKSIERAAEFSWTKTANQIITVLNEEFKSE